MDAITPAYIASESVRVSCMRILYWDSDYPQFENDAKKIAAAAVIGEQEQTLREIIEDAVWKALERNNWNKQLAANELGISLKSIYNHVKRMNRD